MTPAALRHDPPASSRDVATASVLEARGLRRAFGGRRVVDGVDLRVAAGEVVGLLGPNGAGKTTTFRMLAGLLTPDAGEVWLAGRDVTDLPLHARARRGLGYLPQEASVFRGLTVRENLLAVLELQGVARAAREARAEALLAELGLATVAASRATTLSGGERRRTEIARALCNRPRVLMLDEPFAGIDPRAVEELVGIVRGLAGDGIGVLLTDHMVREALAVCDRAYVLDHAAIVVEGHPQDVARDERARAVWLGDRFTL